MKPINIFCQVEGIHAQQHLEALPDESLASLKARIVEKHQLVGVLVLLLEDSDDHVDEAIIIAEIVSDKGAKLHVHRCKHTAVTVSFGARTLERSFGSGATIARIKHWATDELGMSKDDATEHVLQIKGTHNRPTASTHVGALVTHPNCNIAFDLVPDERVNG